MRSAFWGLASLLAFSAYSVSAGAQGGEDSPRAREEASRFYNEGLKAAEAGRWDEARESFLRAWGARKHWQIAANLGRAEIMLKKHRDAAEHLTYFLRNAPRETSKEELSKARELLMEARANVAEVTITVDVSGSDVLVSGALVGRAPLSDPIFVDPGSVVIEARREGYSPSRRSVDAAAGSSHTVDLRLTPHGAADRGAPSPVLMMSGIFASGALAGVGVASAVISRSKKAEAAQIHDRFQLSEAQCMEDGPCTRTRNAAREQYSTFAHASLFTLVGACAVGAGTAVYALTGSSSVKGSAFVGPNGGMVGISAVW